MKRGIFLVFVIVLIVILILVVLLDFFSLEERIERPSKSQHINKLLQFTCNYYVDSFARLDVNEPYVLLSVDDLIKGGVLSEDNPLSKSDREKYFIGYLFDKTENAVYQFVIGPQNVNCNIDFKRFTNDFNSITFPERLEKLKKYYLDAQNLDHIIVGKRERPEKKQK